MDIDFVVPWVDSSDPDWIKQFNRYSPVKKDVTIDASDERYRDNGLLRYWFRGVEQNAPWVRKIFFITNGQKPGWLNANHKKLVWIKHEDYIPQRYLPVFNSHPIEIYIHAIPELSETFVYFNDDMYMINPTGESFFFRKNLPCDSAIIKCITPSEQIAHIQMNDLIEINRNFDKNDILRRSFSKFFNLKYAFHWQCMSALFCLNKKFLGFYVPHTPQPFLKSVFFEVWNRCEDILSATAANRFRSISDVNQYIFKYWQLVTGNFAPVNLMSGRRYFPITSKTAAAAGKALKNKNIKTICLNDIEGSDKYYPQLVKMFEEKFPKKSEFEIWA